jgi:hypothetical protein
MDSNQLHVRNGGKEGAKPGSFLVSGRGQVGGDQSMAILKEMNELEAGHDEFVKSLAPRVDVF